ncbi:GcvT family protein [Parasedimentitalea psychrophila]|uniref:FAD-dependent oxidoreductase n=1 Tax=Parasedimentitalea psychrophila TaxID=2997337 RepID=A0A9Y2L043_9RHOB|nr:FAD-dependent oxidoreductase [Parasedimentitalea psychrophila]WIY24379.1 FAD-dependent oxidoreductase [Parasedimentitalea psychrophila]
MTKAFPTSARIIVIGGGAIGTSIAYHLAKSGERDVLLLEKTRLTEGATWHAAGLVGQFRSQQNLMSLMNDSVSLFDGLAADTGQEIGWRKVGSMRVAGSQDRWQELLKSHSAARAVGFDMELLTPKEAQELYPLMQVEDLVGAAFIPEDGHVDPYSLTQAYAKGIRKYGGRVIEGVMVTDLVRQNNRISHVVTDHGTVEADIVVNAAGLWARQVGKMAGVELPAGIVQHQYFVTEKTSDIPDDLPAFRDPDGGYYAKPEPGALAIGGWERTTDKVNPKEGFPWENARHLFDTNMDRMEEVFLPAAHRLPLLNHLGVRTVVNGPIPISPDGEPVMGPVSGLQNFFVACAFTSGIAASGGVGKAAANWILNGDPGLDLWAFDLRRFGPLQSGQKFLHDRAVESYTKYYDIHWPGEEMQTARMVRRSPIYDRLKQDGAVMGSKFGWERANWFAHSGIAQKDQFGFDRAGQAETVGREHRAARETAVLTDQTSFTKFEISGSGACSFLQYLAVANVDKPVGGAAYTQLCNERGGIEADVTIIRRAEDCFWLITGSALGERDRDWIDRNLETYRKKFTDDWVARGEQWERSSRPGGPDIQIRNITSALGVLNIQGPKARMILQKLCDEDLGNEAFPFMTAKDIRVGYAPALAYRVTYVGELGWELYIPTEYLAYVYEILLEAGTVEGLINMGYHAIDSLRLEKRYLAWGPDINSDNNPFEAGLQFLIDWGKGDFIGRDALTKIRENGVKRKMTALLLDDPLPVFGGEAVYFNGNVVAQTTSGNFAYTLGKPIVLAYLPTGIDLGSGVLEVQSFDQRSAATAVKGIPYDPQREKIQC